MSRVCQPMASHAICQECGWVWKPEDGDHSSFRAHQNARVAARLHAKRRKHPVQVLRRTVYDFRRSA